MADVFYQQPAQGWGFGHQGERLFNTAPAYSGIPFHEDHGGMESPSSLPDSEEELSPYDAIYGELDLHRIYGQQIAIWTYKNPDTVSLFTPIPGDTFMTIVAFARTSLEFNTAVDRMMVLLPGHKRPLEMDSVFIVKPGTAILIAPLYDYMVSIEVKQLGHKIDMVLHITITVLELKNRLQTEHGYPADRMDILYRDKPMENTRYLFEYGLAHSSTLFVLLMLKYDTLIHVDTFWGKQYHLFVDSCTTGFGIIASILRRTVSQNAVDIVRLYELFLPKHTLVLFSGTRVVDLDHCLGFYSIESGSVLKLSTIGLAHEMAIQKIPVVLDSGDTQKLLASKFDRWSTIVLKLHGMTGYPVNLMKLMHNGKLIDFSDTIGSISKSRDTVELDVSAIKKDDDLLYGIPLKFKIARGITELLKVAPSRTIKSVKDTLERIGVPNASMHDLVVEGYRLPADKRVVDVIEEYRVPIELSLKQYPVFIHGHQNVIYKMLAYGKETLATFLMRVNMKTGLSFKDFLLLVCGNVLNDDESLPVFDTRISIKSSVFLIPRKQYRSFFILHDDWMTKLRIPAYPKLKKIKEILWKERTVPEGGLASIGNFLQWYFAGHSKDSDVKNQTLLKERMMVYEANVGNKYLQMKVEPSKPRKIRQKVDNHQDVSEMNLEKLNLKPDKKKRAQSLPAKRPPGKLKLPQISRHLSADVTRKEPHHRHKRRKAYTTLPVPKPRQSQRDRYKRKSHGILPPPAPQYEYTNFNDQQKADGNGLDNREMVFCLRHDFSINPNKGRQRNMYE